MTYINNIKTESFDKKSGVSNDLEQNILCNELYDLATSHIPEMLFHSSLIILNGKINSNNIRILLDTGASSCVIFNKTINKLNLSEYIDDRDKIMIRGIGEEKSVGRLWYIELELDNYILPISATILNSDIKDFDMILGINFLQTYSANIDFATKTLKLNNEYNIHFNLETFD